MPRKPNPNAGPNGGARPGAGRKTKHDEQAIKSLAITSIEKCYGSLEEGFIALLKSKQHPLVRFVFEHAVGKPRELVTSEVSQTITFNETKTYKKK